MAQSTTLGGHGEGLASTKRTDRYWVEPLLTGLGFLGFVVYTSWSAYQGEYYWHGSYLSPFYSPLLYVDPSAPGSAPLAHAWLGEFPAWLKQIWPPWFPRSPAWLILIGPLSFRLTCYYYRKFYYRSFFLSPPACAVGALPRRQYKGETALLVFQNLHRYTWYIAVAYIGILAYDAVVSLWRDGQFGIGVGSVVMFANAALLGFYTLGCHAGRHLAGGGTDCFSCSPTARARHQVWRGVTRLNEHHMLWAWVSMIWVGLTDLYVRLAAMGMIRDFNTWE